MPRSNYYTHGTSNEQLFHEDLVVESLHIYGTDFYYIPRTLVGKNEILGEDRLSKFKSAYQIEMYLENVDGFDGQGAFIQKFGLMMEQSATLVVARRRWEQLVGRYGDTIIPSRPCEGDLIYFPLTDGLFEIKFVSHQDPFYQIGKLFVYKLQVELFQYSSEKLETGVEEIDVFETLKSFDVDVLDNGIVSSIDVNLYGDFYDSNTTILIGDEWEPNIELSNGHYIAYGNYHYEAVSNGVTGEDPPIHTSGTAINGTVELKFRGIRAQANAIIGTDEHSAGKLLYIELIEQGNGYAFPPKVNIIGVGSGATATANISSYDTPQSYGDNKKFKDQANNIIFNESNPFGDIL